MRDKKDKEKWFIINPSFHLFISVSYLLHSSFVNSFYLLSCLYAISIFWKCFLDVKEMKKREKKQTNREIKGLGNGIEMRQEIPRSNSGHSYLLSLGYYIWMKM